MKYHGGSSEPFGLQRWQVGDVIGCILDLSDCLISKPQHYPLNIFLSVLWYLFRSNNADYLVNHFHQSCVTVVFCSSGGKSV